MVYNYNETERLKYKSNLNDKSNLLTTQLNLPIGTAAVLLLFGKVL